MSGEKKRCGRPLVPTASGRTAARLLLRTCFFPRGKFSSCEIPKQHPAQGGVLFWYSRRESNPQRPLRRGLLYPFNYGSLSENAKKINCKPNIFILHHLHEKCKDFRGGMRRLPKFKLCVHVYRLIAFCLVLGVRIPKPQASDSIPKKTEGRNSLILLRCGSRVALGQKHLCGKGKGRVWVA